MRRISSETYKQIKDYLLAHESDIALDINDFGCLRNAFIEIFERFPKE